jgi:hypothetical protein
MDPAEIREDLSGPGDRSGGGFERHIRRYWRS